MPFRMAELKRSKSGAFVARKVIPENVRDEYERLYDVRWEAKFHRSADLRPQDAKAQHAEWLSLVESRIAAIRDKRRGSSRDLTEREARALAGEWYRWFVRQHEDNPGAPQAWLDRFWAAIDHLTDHADLEALHEQGLSTNPLKDWTWTQDPEVRAGARPAFAKEAKADQFLADRGMTLTPRAHDLFVDCVIDEYVKAVDTIQRRAEGDYSADAHLKELPEFSPAPQRHKTTALTPWSLFEAYVAARQPGRSTVDRWRSVFLDLEKHFKGRPASNISPDDAHAWAEGLLTKERSARTVNDIWCAAARVVFGWAVKTKKLSSNPFVGAGVTQPRKVRTRETDEFTPDEARLILKASLDYDDKRPFDAARRWVPWLCAYTGARGGEMTQLRGKDFRQQNGLWVIQITPEAGTVKTGKPRTVPLHEHLVDQGFPAFVRSKGDGPLFYDATSPSKVTKEDATNPARPRAVKTRERLAAWVRDIGITDNEVRPNHAWRHTFKRRAARAGIEVGIRDAICGHSPRAVADIYETPTVDDMARALAKFPPYETDTEPSSS